jgi:signal transduction histidine kinase
VGVPVYRRSVTPPSWGSRDDAWWARAAAVAAAVVTAVSLTALRQGPGPGWEIIVFGAVQVAGFLTKSAWPAMPTPLLALWTMVPPLVLNFRGDGEGTMFLLIVAVSYLTLIEPDRRVRLGIGAVGVAAPVVINQFAYDRWGWPYWTMGVFWGWLSAGQVRRFRLLVAELNTTRERLAAQAVDAERRRLAAELHDLVGHSLTVVLLHLTGARRRIRDDPAGAEAALVQAEEIGRRSLAEIRRNVVLLRGDGAGERVAPTPAASDVPDLVTSAVAAGADVRLEVHGALLDVEAVVGLAVYRVVQECLANAAKHAEGGVVGIEIDVTADVVVVEVTDRGGRSTATGPPGVGLVGMRERVESLGGTLAAGPDGAGWRVRARLPRPVGLRRSVKARR